MKEYNLIEYSNTSENTNNNLPVKDSSFNKLKRFFSFELSPKQEKVIDDVKNFWTQELDFSEFREFWNNEFKLSSIFSKKSKNTVKENIDNVDEENKL